jgi:hypothetical protein
MLEVLGWIVGVGLGALVLTATVMRSLRWVVTRFFPGRWGQIQGPLLAGWLLFIALSIAVAAWRP